MKMMVCYTSGSLSKEVVRVAQEHAKKWNAKIEVVKIVQRDQPIKRSKIEEMEAEFEQTIEALFRGSDIAYSAELQIDDVDVGEKIVAIARRKKIGLLFMGLKKRSRVGKLLFGSNAQHVLLHAHCPVVTVNPE